MEITTYDCAGKKVVAEATFDNDPMYKSIVITAMYDDAVIKLDLLEARRFASGIKLLAQIALDEQKEAEEALDNHK